MSIFGRFNSQFSHLPYLVETYVTRSGSEQVNRRVQVCKCLCVSVCVCVRVFVREQVCACFGRVLGHVARQEDTIILKCVLFGELQKNRNGRSKRWCGNIVHVLHFISKTWTMLVIASGICRLTVFLYFRLFKWYGRCKMQT